MSLRSIVVALILVFGALLMSHAEEVQQEKKKNTFSSDFDETGQFIFFSVLEGLYEDGVSTKDVDQILWRKGKDDYYFHFIYACPVCTPTIWALESYQSRPKTFYRSKHMGGTFGRGLSEDVKKQLFSEEKNTRLIAINTLMKDWIARRMSRMNLSDAQRAELLAQLEKKRKQGMNMLEGFRNPYAGQKPSISLLAPAYIDLEECAICNGAVGELMKIPESKSERKTP